MQDQWRVKYMTSSREAQRLQNELDKAIQSMSNMETKLNHARRLLEMESKLRRDAEMDRDSSVSIQLIYPTNKRSNFYFKCINFIVGKENSEIIRGSSY